MATNIKKRILVIDDEPAFTNLLRLNLERACDCEVRELNEAAGVLRTVREFEPQLIFLDVVMPGMDGGDVASLLRSDPASRGIPIIFLTALVEGEETPAGGLLSGSRCYLSKPPNVAQLLECIARVDDSAKDLTAGVSDAGRRHTQQ